MHTKNHIQKGMGVSGLVATIMLSTLWSLSVVHATSPSSDDENGINTPKSHLYQLKTRKTLKEGLIKNAEPEYREYEDGQRINEMDNPAFSINNTTETYGYSNNEIEKFTGTGKIRAFPLKGEDQINTPVTAEKTEENIIIHKLNPNLKMENLTKLRLNDNKISDEGAKAIANSSHMQNLIKLRLNDNKISDEGANAIANSFLNAKSD